MTSFMEDQPPSAPRMEQLTEEQLREVGRVERNPATVSPTVLGKLDAWAHYLPHGEDRDRVERAIARASRKQATKTKSVTDDQIKGAVDAAFRKQGYEED